MNTLLPKLRLVDSIEGEYLFSYMIDGTVYYSFVKEDGNKYRINIGTTPNEIIMIVERESKIGKEITLQISNL